MLIKVETSIGGDWAKVGQNIKDGDRIQIKDAGQVIEGQFGEQFVFKILTSKKEEYNLAMNRTSRNNLAKGYGAESEVWVGKVAQAFVVKQMVGDGLKNVLYLAPDGWTMTDDGEFQPKEELEPPAFIKNRTPKEEDINPDDIPF